MSVRAPQPGGGGPSAPARLPGHLRRRLALALSLALAGGQAARAEGNVKDPGAPFPYTTVWMPRSTSMAGAHAAVATSNDAFLVNPAGLAQARRYHLEIDGALDPQFPGSGFIVTAVDASSLAVASGLMYARFSTGHLDRRGAGFLLGAAYAYDIGGIYFGGVTKYLHFDGPDGQSYKFAQDFGLLLRRGNVSWAVTGQNLALSNVPLFPPSTTFAFALGSDADYHLAVDYKLDLQDTSRVKHKLSVGYEFLIEQAFAPRIGFARDFTQGLSWFATGFGFLTEKGGLQFAYQRRVQGGFDHIFEVGLTLYLE
jgi:hypothetical protein